MNTPRREFEERQYIEAAFFLQVPAKKLRALHITPATPLEFDSIDAVRYDLNDRCLIKYHQDKFYYRGNPSANKLLCSAYVISQKQIFQLSAMLSKLYDWELRNQRIRETYKRYLSGLQYDLDALGVNVPTFSLQNFSIKTINKIMAKHKGTAEFTDDSLKLTFNKVKCGNEIEGYVNYKSITVFLPLDKMGTRNLNSNRIIYTFQKFSIDTYDKINGVPTLHPHISSSSDSNFCFGNRDEDWDIYAETYNFPFMIDLIYESLHTFNPGSPYIHVNTLINVIKTLNVVYKDYKKMNPQSNPSELASHIFRGVNRCRNCGTVLGTDGKCFVETCHANPNALIPCRKCGVHKERGEWDASEGVYTWICRNTSCTASPDYVRPPVPEGTPICRVCGEALMITDSHYPFPSGHFDGVITETGHYDCYACRNGAHHYTRGLWQIVRNSDTGQLIDLNGFHATDSFEHEQIRWDNDHPATVTTTTT